MATNVVASRPPERRPTATPTARGKRECLNVGKVPTFRIHNVGTVPTFEMHNIGTVPTFKMHNVGTPIFLKIIFGA